jgi:hypothetical protein
MFHLLERAKTPFQTLIVSQVNTTHPAVTDYAFYLITITQ